MRDLFDTGEIQPIVGRTRVTASMSWEESALAQPGSIEERIRDLGLSEQEANRAGALVDEFRPLVAAESERLAGASYLDAPDRPYRRSALQRLDDWFTGREIETLETSEAVVKVPLWTFSAPDVDGCTASVEQAQTRGAALSFDVSFLGSGLGATTDVHSSTMWKFGASSGQTKVIFLSATARLSRIAVLEGGRQISTGYDAEVIPSSVSEPAILLLGKADQLSMADVIKTYPLEGDKSGDLAEYRYEYGTEAGTSMTIGVEALGISAKIKPSVSINGSLALTFQLRGGFDYELHRIAEGHGLVWSRPDRDRSCARRKPRRVPTP
jgi:hypothetical protein